MSIDCGGCQGKGSHRRWCGRAHGRLAGHYGPMSERLKGMADSVGANDPALANHLYVAAAKMAALATRFKEAHHAKEAGQPTTDVAD